MGQINRYPVFLQSSDQLFSIVRKPGVRALIAPVCGKRAMVIGRHNNPHPYLMEKVNRCIQVIMMEKFTILRSKDDANFIFRLGPQNIIRLFHKQHVVGIVVNGANIIRQITNRNACICLCIHTCYGKGRNAGFC